MVRVFTWDSIDQHVGIDQVDLHSSTIAIEAAEPSSAASIDPHYYDIVLHTAHLSGPASGQEMAYPPPLTAVTVLPALSIRLIGDAASPAFQPF